MKYLSPHRKVFKTFKNLLKRVFTTFTPPSNVQLIYTVVRTLVNFIHHPYLIKPSFSPGSCCKNYHTYQWWLHSSRNLLTSSLVLKYLLKIRSQIDTAGKNYWQISYTQAPSQGLLSATFYLPLCQNKYKNLIDEQFYLNCQQCYLAQIREYM